MKKFAFLFVLVVVLAVASVAYASTFSTYAAWDEAYNNGIQGTASSSPHYDYRLNTVKCAVCHAVHKAAPAGELLLRGLAADACTYCHITTNIGVDQIYGGVVGNYSNAVDSGYAHNFNTVGVGANVNSVRCVDCHSVHGANIFTDDANLIGNKILRINTATDIMQAAQTWDSMSTTSDAANGDDDQIAVFCTQCHPYYDGVSASTGITVVNAYGSGQTGNFQSHIMTDTLGGFDGTGATYSGQVAWVNTSSCRKCHDAGTTNSDTAMNANSFPHMTNAERFVQVATSTAQAAAAGAGAANADATYDGACLKCHVNDAAAGVGITY